MRPLADRHGMDQDLLRPSLTAEDDAGELHAPWNPTSLHVLTFFFGLPGAGPFLLWNFGRLGLTRGFRAAAAIVVLVSCVVEAGATWARLHLELGAGGRSQSISFAAHVMYLLAAWPIVSWQRRRFRLASWLDQPKGNIWVAILGALAIRLGVSAVEVAVLRMLGYQGGGPVRG